MANRDKHEHSMETILRVDNQDELSEWSVAWSTSHVPGMDAGIGGGGRRVAGRRRLRIGALAFGGFLSMHCRITFAALSGGFFVFTLLLVTLTALLANPLRHFEVYLGQWSISGPGRAFRILPMLDGIGIAICINAIVRAIVCCTIAAIAALYVFHSVSDQKLPFTFCRDFNLNSYEPEVKTVSFLRMNQIPLPYNSREVLFDEEKQTEGPTTVGTYPLAWRNVSRVNYRQVAREKETILRVCNETYSGEYPPIIRTPAYNYFFIEIARLRSDNSMTKFNVPLLASILVMWALIWAVLISERISHGRLIWNNMYPWFLVIPWIWMIVLILSSAAQLLMRPKAYSKVFRLMDSKQIVGGASDAAVAALYIHAASLGVELIHGKGLNHYACGHIDPHLNSENMWHSAILVLQTILNSGAAAMCALVGSINPDVGYSHIKESTLWILPMYSKCTSLGNYSHLLSTLVFAGLVFSYMTVAFILLKSALHTIFEYRVKLVFIEQVVVGVLILTCTLLSLTFATHGGLPLLESIDAIMTGVSMPFVCLLELVALLYVYGSHDFVSDMHLATEENACASRIDTQWQIIPFLTAVTIILKFVVIGTAEMPAVFMYVAILPLACIVLAVPLRAVHNAYVFLRPAPRHGT